MLRSVFVLLAAFALCGCKSQKTIDREKRREELRALMHGNSADPAIAAAMKRAQETLPEFLAALQKPAPGQSRFMVRRKFPAKEQGKQQVLIVNQLTYDGTKLHGVLDDNTAQQGSGVAKDGRVSFPPADVCDWMFHDNGKAAGGFMLRALKEKMTPEEWQPIAEQIGSFRD